MQQKTCETAKELNMKWKIEDIGVHCNILTTDNDPVGMGFPKPLVERLVKKHNESLAVSPTKLKALDTAIELLEEQNSKEQFVDGEGFYPVCVACGRTNVEHNMTKPIEDCSWVDHEETLASLKELATKLAY